MDKHPAACAGAQGPRCECRCAGTLHRSGRLREPPIKHKQRGNTLKVKNKPTANYQLRLPLGGSSNASARIEIHVK